MKKNNDEDLLEMVNAVAISGYFFLTLVIQIERDCETLNEEPEIGPKVIDIDHPPGRIMGHTHTAIKCRSMCKTKGTQCCRFIRVINMIRNSKHCINERERNGREITFSIMY